MTSLVTHISHPTMANIPHTLTDGKKKLKPLRRPKVSLRRGKVKWKWEKGKFIKKKAGKPESLFQRVGWTKTVDTPCNPNAKTGRKKKQTLISQGHPGVVPEAPKLFWNKEVGKSTGWGKGHSGGREKLVDAEAAKGAYRVSGGIQNRKKV